MNNHTPLKATALIITHRRADLLERCVRSLIADAQNTPSLDIKIRIAINGTDPQSQMVAQALVHEFKNQMDPVETIVQPLTPAAARNQILKSMMDPWILFIDDDAYIDPGYLKQFLKMREQFPSAIAFGGPNLTPPQSSRLQMAAGDALSSRLATFTSNARYRPHGVARLSDERELILCNLWIQRDVLPTPAFPEDFQCAEENWLMQSLAQSQLQAIHDPKLYAWHERRPQLSSFARQVYKYGHGRGQNLSRRPQTVRLAYLVPPLAIAFLVYSIVQLARQDSLNPYLLPAAPDLYFTLCRRIFKKIVSSLIDVFSFSSHSYFLRARFSQWVFDRFF